MANSVDPDQTAPIGAVCSRSMMFASILNSSVMLGNYLKQTTFSDTFFSWRFKGLLFPSSYTPSKLCLLFSRCPTVRSYVTFCFLNILKSHCWNYIKPCKHIHIYKAKTFNKKVRATHQFC